MPTELIMPKLGMGMEKGTVVEWVKRKHDRVSKGDVVVIVSSDKIEIEVESPADGLLLDIAVPEGAEVPVGTVIGYVGQEGDAINGSDKGGKSPSASPVARKLAREAGIDLASIEGTGPNGRITKEDVERAIANKPNGQSSAPGASPQEAGPLKQEGKEQDSLPLSGEDRSATYQKVAGMRKVIAQRMMTSLQQSAQLTMTAHADVTQLLQLKDQIELHMEQRYDIKPSLSAYIARAVTLALLKYPMMNSKWENDTIVSFHTVHLGIAVALDKGLVVPVIRQAERLSVGHLAQAIKQLSEKARAGQLTVEEMQGSTFTITNLGQYGVEWFTPILNPPEAGILGVGATHTVPVYEEGRWEARQLLPLSLTFDHRILDGAPAAQFLQEVKHGLENPLQLLV